jgi:hypothetical protein
MRAVCIQAKLLANLRIGQIEPQKVEAQYPNSKWLMMAGKNGSREIVKLSFTVAAMVTLPIFLRLVKTSLGNAARTAGNATDAIGPSHPPNLFKALPIIHQ